ncbi:MAG: mannosyltransferase family protein [Polyangiaceae bacterium]
MSRSTLRYVATTFFATRLAMLALAWASSAVMAEGPFPPPIPGRLGFFVRWDVSWFLSIVRDGYSYTPGHESNVAFFPLFPILVRALAPLTGDIVAGLVIANAALFGAACILHMLARRESGSEVIARRAVLFLFAFPATLFHSVGYCESLFLFLTLATFEAAARQRFFVAGAFALLSAATRSSGVLVTLPLAYEILSPTRVFPRRITLRKEIAALALPPLGLAAYLAYVADRFGSVRVVVDVQRAWGRRLKPPWDAVDSIFHHKPPYALAFGLSLLALVVTFVVLVTRRARPSFVVFAALHLAYMTTSGLVEGMPRFVGAVFPIYLVAATETESRPTTRELLLVGCGVMVGMFVILFFNGYWLT